MAEAEGQGKLMIKISPVGEFGVSMTSLAWQATIGEEIYFVAYHILEYLNHTPSWKESYCLRLNYYEDL
jgi:hypothetical protein